MNSASPSAITNAVTTYGVIFFSRVSLRRLSMARQMLCSLPSAITGVPKQTSGDCPYPICFMAAGLIGLTSASLMFFCPELLVHLFISMQHPSLLPWRFRYTHLRSRNSHQLDLLLHAGICYRAEAHSYLKRSQRACNFYLPHYCRCASLHSDSTYFGGHL